MQYTKEDTYRPIPVAAQQLRDQLRAMQREQPGREVDLIAHSQGGVVVAYFLDHYNPAGDATLPPLGTVVTLSSPLQGTPLATAASDVGASPLGQAVLDVVDGHVAMPSPNAVSVRQLSQNSSLIREIQQQGVPNDIDFTSIGATDDWTVPASNISLRGAQETTVAVANPGFSEHRDIVEDPNALRAVRAALEGTRAAVRRSRRRAPGGDHAGRDRSRRAARRKRRRSRPFGNPRSGSVKHRTFVFAVVMAAVLAVPTPARPDTSTWPSPIWSSALTGVPWGLTTDTLGAVVVTDVGRVRALHFDGTTQWDVAVDAAEDGYPAVSKDLVLVGAAGRVVALGRNDGKVRWQQPTDGPVRAVALAGAYAIAGDGGGTLRAFLAGTGALAWSGHWDGVLRSPPQVDVAASVVLAIWSQSPMPAARGLDLATGALRWELPVGLHTAAPGLDHGRAVIATDDGNAHAVVVSGDAARGPGPEGWWLLMPGLFESGAIPAVDSHDLVVIDRIGRVTAFDPVSGALRWTRPLNVDVVDTRVVLLPRRVLITALLGQVFVLDRASGRVVAHAGPSDFDGDPVLAAPARRPDRILLAISATVPATVEMHRVP